MYVYVCSIRIMYMYARSFVCVHVCMYVRVHVCCTAVNRCMLYSSKQMYVVQQ
jgi:hypothetical protein